MKAKLILSMLVILIAIVATVGGTMAWFTAEEEITPNVFTAGTVTLTAYDSWVDGEDNEIDNWNPGDCSDKTVKVTYKGTKRAFLRMLVEETWEDTDSEDGAWNDRAVPNVEWKVPDPNSPGDYIEWNDPAKWYLGADDFWYYDGDDTETSFELDLKAGGSQTIHALLGNYDGHTSDEIIIMTKVCLDGLSTDNAYQGATYTVAIKFQAIQASHYGEWEWQYFEQYN